MVWHECDILGNHGLASSIPLLSILLVPTVFIFIAGIVKGAATQSRGEELRFDHLFSAFKSHWQPLAIVGLLYLVGIVLCMIPLFIAMGSMMFSMMTGNMGNPYAMNDVSIAGLAVGYLLSMLLMIPLYMAVWFAPALVALHDIDAITAMKKSFQAGIINIVPSLWLGMRNFTACISYADFGAWHTLSASRYLVDLLH